MSAYSTGRFHDGERWACVLWRTGRTRLHVTLRDDLGMRHLTAPLEEARYLVPLLYQGKPYPLARMVKKFCALSRARGATESAKAELREALYNLTRGEAP